MKASWTSKSHPEWDHPQQDSDTVGHAANMPLIVSPKKAQELHHKKHTPIPTVWSSDRHERSAVLPASWMDFLSHLDRGTIPALRSTKLRFGHPRLGGWGPIGDVLSREPGWEPCREGGGCPARARCSPTPDQEHPLAASASGSLCVPQEQESSGRRREISNRGKRAEARRVLRRWRIFFWSHLCLHVRPNGRQFSPTSWVAQNLLSLSALEHPHHQLCFGLSENNNKRNRRARPPNIQTKKPNTAILPKHPQKTPNESKPKHPANPTSLKGLCSQLWSVLHLH